MPGTRCFTSPAGALPRLSLTPAFHLPSRRVAQRQAAAAPHAAEA